jgi:phosphoglycolate phosphatase-like HAD superfamily hydrolase
MKIDSGFTAGLILWDIDGTLIRVKRLDSSSPHKNVLLAEGCLIDESKLGHSGLTDYEVLLNLIKSNNGRIARSRLLSAFNKLDEESHRLDAASIFDLCPGVQSILESLISNGWVQGILSGNTKSRILSKLENAGILNYFTRDLMFGCEFGDSRNNIARRAKEFLQYNKFLRISVIGDTPSDITSARSVNFPVIAVATGSFTFTQLSSCNPDLLLRDLSVDAEILFKFLN